MSTIQSIALVSKIEHITAMKSNIFTWK